MKNQEAINWTPFQALTFKAQEILKKAGYTVSWQDMAEAIYSPFTELAKAVSVGDTIELPNGCSLLVEWKPGKNQNNT
jgi:hypothetical protein